MHIFEWPHRKLKYSNKTHIFYDCIQQSDLNPNLVFRYNIIPILVEMYFITSANTNCSSLFQIDLRIRRRGTSFFLIAVPCARHLVRFPLTEYVVTMFLDKSCCRNRGEIPVWAVNSWITLAVFFFFFWGGELCLNPLSNVLTSCSVTTSL